MDAGRWGWRPQAMRWRRARARQAWLRQARQTLAFRRVLLEMMRERIDILDRRLATEFEEEAESARPTQAVQRIARRKDRTRPDIRRAALFAVFDEMEEHEQEFLQDGKPRVEAVNDRLNARGQRASATRNEIDEAFEAWMQSRNPEAD